MIGISSISTSISYNLLVGGFNHLEKYEFVNGKDYPFILWKIKNVPNHQPVFYEIYDIVTIVDELDGCWLMNLILLVIRCYKLSLKKTKKNWLP